MSLYRLGRTICKVMGMRALRNERLGSALSWGLRSKDVQFATVLAEKFVHYFFNLVRL